MCLIVGFEIGVYPIEKNSKQLRGRTVSLFHPNIYYVLIQIPIKFTANNTLRLYIHISNYLDQVLR
jgi:hypothetical protein